MMPCPRIWEVKSMSNGLCEICGADVVLNAKYGRGGYLELEGGMFVCRSHVHVGDVKTLAVEIHGECLRVRQDE